MYFHVAAVCANVMSSGSSSSSGDMSKLFLSKCGTRVSSNL